ncbi:hypothetical protein Bca52824_052606 [Brassica carinata]|uniref:Uncharacterized protein n=1 Tax=Brassica carinata TaxID=52824 RepID=A0A8X7UKY5_BRACI|nr:hypothetical protein Bca52824_052606 [Brassica carinata]
MASMSPSPPLAPPRDLSSKSAQIPVVLCSGEARRRFAVVGVVLQIPRREGSYSTMVHFLLFAHLVLRLSIHGVLKYKFFACGEIITKNPATPSKWDKISCFSL